jgi:hydroxypyruvate isomerase
VTARAFEKGNNSMDRRTFLTSAVAGVAIPAVAGRAVFAAGAPARSQEKQPAENESPQKPAAFKLKYAPHSGMFANHAADDVDQIQVMAELGFNAYEDNGMRGRPKEQQEKLARAMEKHKVEMGIFVANDGGFGSLLARGDQESKDRFVKNMNESVEVAKRMNAKWMTVVPGIVEERLPMGIQTANVIDGLKRGAEVLEKHGLVMVCEPLNWRDHPRLFLRYSPDAYAIMKAVGSPSCKILFDMYHQQVSEGNLIDNIDKCWDEIGYFQIGDNPGRNEPGTGEVNYKNVFRHIARKGYTGILGMEHGNSKPGKDGELAVVRAYREADSFEM